MDMIFTTFLPKMLPGLLISLQVTFGVVLLGIPLGVVLALGMLSESRVLRVGALAMVEVFRGIPSLVFLYIVYFGLPQFGVVLDAVPSACLALGLSMAGYLADVFRAALQAVPAGQREAAMAVGLNRRSAFFWVVVPQMTRIAAPPVLGYVISYFQATALAYAIAVPELMSKSYNVASSNFRFLEALTIAGVLYALICIPADRFVNRLSSDRKKRATA